MSAPNDEFDRIVKGMHVNGPSEHIDQNPYGAPTQHHKPGLTTRGKAALGIGAAVIVGGGLVGYQTHSANVAQSEAKAQEIALKSQALELEKIRELNRASKADREATTSQEKARQASVDTCVKNQSDQAGKGFAPSYRDVVSACQEQYSSTSSSSDMQAAASTNSASSNSGGGVNTGLLVGAGVLVVFVGTVAKKSIRSNPA